VNGLEIALAFSVVEVKSHPRRAREMERKMMHGERVLYLDSVSPACIHRIKAPVRTVDKAGGMTRAGVVVMVLVYLVCYLGERTTQTCTMTLARYLGWIQRLEIIRMGKEPAAIKVLVIKAHTIHKEKEMQAIQGEGHAGVHESVLDLVNDFLYCYARVRLNCTNL
jgi:hypothetical protein